MDYKKLAISIALPLLAGMIGALTMQDSVQTWYETLQKPSFSPPNWIFGPVWTTLYILMGITLYLLWTSKNNKTAIRLFTVQLFLNAIWSPLFFGLHSMALALADIIALWMAIIATIIATHKISKTAAYLLMPYLLWVSFALILNATLLSLN